MLSFYIALLISRWQGR